MVEIKNLKWIIALGALMLTVSACGSSNATLTPLTTRAATQTPWIIYVPITTTPEPTLLPLLPTAEPKTTAVPTRPPTRVAVKPTTAPTKPVVIATKPAATAAPTCVYGAVTLKEPENNALRRTKEVGVGGDTFRFIWDPPPELQGEVDAQVGYRLSITSRRGTWSNGATLYFSHNWFLRNGKLFILDKPAVSTLAAGEPAKVTWNVTVIRTSGSFNDTDPTVGPPGIITCGSPSETRSIDLQTFE